MHLVRSRGVGVYFVTQSPSDVPDGILAQLSNRIQHALRAYTPTEQRFVKAAARAFRPNKGVDVEKAVLDMGLGEALKSTLVDDGVPMPVERVKVALPAGQIGPLSDLERKSIIEQSPMRQKYPSIVEGERHIHDFQNRQRAARGLGVREWAGERTQTAMSVEDALAPVLATGVRPAKNWRRGLYLGMGWLVASAVMLWQAGVLT